MKMIYSISKYFLVVSSKLPKHILISMLSFILLMKIARHAEKHKLHLDNILSSRLHLRQYFLYTS